MNTVDRVKAICKERKIAISKLEKDCGFANGYIGQLKKGSLPDDRAITIAKYLGVSLGELLDDPSSSSAAIPEGLHAIRRISLPILGEVACGEPKYAAEEYHGTVSAEGDFHADFCLIAKGDSMSNIGIHEGTIVFIRSQQAVENGEVAVVLYEDDATLKRVYFYPDAGLMVLHAENPRYKDMTFTGEQLNSVRILGKAVFYQNTIE